jgi:hypothetical protein
MVAASTCQAFGARLGGVFWVGAGTVESSSNGGSLCLLGRVFGEDGFLEGLEDFASGEVASEIVALAAAA